MRTSSSSIKIADDGSLFDIFSWPSLKPGSISVIHVKEQLFFLQPGNEQLRNSNIITTEIHISTIIRQNTIYNIEKHKQHNSGRSGYDVTE
jgi:hypothetical protein